MGTQNISKGDYYPQIGVLVLNWNGMSIKYNKHPLLKTCLDFLLKTDYPNFRTLVVDASSADDSLQYIKKNYPTVETLVVENKSWSYNNNAGIRHLLSKFKGLEYIVIMSNDILSKDSQWLKKTLPILKSDVRIGLLGFKLVGPDGITQYTGLELKKYGGFEPSITSFSGKMGKTQFIVGAIFVAKSKMLVEIGLLDESYIMMGSEDTDICERARLADYLVFHTNEVQLEHVGSASTFSLSDDIPGRWQTKEIRFNMTVNNYIFLMRWSKLKLLNYLIYDTLSRIIQIRPKVILKKPTFYDIMVSFRSLIVASRIYKTPIIRYPGEQDL